MVGTAGYRIPDVDWDRTNGRVMTIEWVDGIKISDTDALKAAGHDTDDIATRLVLAFLKQAIAAGFFHADMHQGNLFVKPDGTIAAIDFGIMGRIDRRARMWLAEILYGLTTGNYRRVAEIHFEAQYVPSYHNVDEFATALRAVGEPMRGKPVSELSVGQMLDGLFAITRDFDMQTQPHLLLLQKTMVMVEGIATQLNPRDQHVGRQRALCAQLDPRRTGPRSGDRRSHPPGHRDAAAPAGADPPDRGPLSRPRRRARAAAAARNRIDVGKAHAQGGRAQLARLCSGGTRGRFPGMAGGSAGLDRLTAEKAAPAWDRFAHWRAGPARLLLAVLAVLLLLAALGPPEGASPVRLPQLASAPIGASGTAPPRERDDDLAFYDRVIERVAGGEDYYDFIVAEQRARDYPVRPGFAVRLPTLAYVHAWLGEPGMVVLAVLLLGATVWAWWRRLGEEPGGQSRRRIGAALMLMGGSLGLNRDYFVLHELWAGMLLALAFGLHRRGGWGWSLAVAAAALAVREHALPFVLLMGAMAAWRRDWKEAANWAALVLAFCAIMAWHLALVAPHVMPGDPEGPDWLVLRGLWGWLGNVVQSSNLRFLPSALAGPLVLLMVFGWAGWRSPAGATGTLLFLGYGLAFMLAGRANNFYWGAVVAPAMFVGLAFLPMALRSLWAAAAGRNG